jgi:hypothetical protein
MGNKKKGPDEAEDALSPEDERRTEGMDAAVFSQPIGYMPTYPAPPKYIRVGFRTILVDSSSNFTCTGSLAS